MFRATKGSHHHSLQEAMQRAWTVSPCQPSILHPPLTISILIPPPSQQLSNWMKVPCVSVFVCMCVCVCVYVFASFHLIPLHSTSPQHRHHHREFGLYGLHHALHLLPLPSLLHRFQSRSHNRNQNPEFIMIRKIFDKGSHTYSTSKISHDLLISTITITMQCLIWISINWRTRLHFHAQPHRNVINHHHELNSIRQLLQVGHGQRM